MRTRSRSTSAVLAVGLILAIASQAQTRLRVSYDDDVVVARSMLIVVGRIKPGSIVYVQHERKPADGISWEHHATLIIREVVKGSHERKELPIIIHYGLTPVVGGSWKQGGNSVNLRGRRTDYPKDIIEIVYTGRRASSKPLVADAGKDNVWFLRQRRGTRGPKAGKSTFGVVDPEDLQPLKLKGYFQAYLATNPIKAVTAQIAKDPSVAMRGRLYLDRADIDRLKKLPDLHARFEALLPYWTESTQWATRQRALTGILTCGEAGCSDLRLVFRNPKYKRLRVEIIRIWGNARYKGCVKDLVELLGAHDEFWAAQKLQNRWWNTDVGSDLTRRRRKIYVETHQAVIALGKIGDPRAAQAIAQTKRRWEQINLENPQMVERCAKVLQTLLTVDLDREGAAHSGYPSRNRRSRE